MLRYPLYQKSSKHTCKRRTTKTNSTDRTRTQHENDLKMIRLGSLLLLLSLPIDARLQGMGRRFLQFTGLCNNTENIASYFNLDPELLTSVCDEERRTGPTFECESIENVPKNYYIGCHSSSECPPWTDGKKRICIYSSWGTAPGTYCHLPETFAGLEKSVKEICDTVGGR